MKVRYNQPKNARIKKGTIKSNHNGKRMNLFCGLNMIFNPNAEEENEILYWCEDINKWCTWDEWKEVGIGSLSSNKYGFNSVRSAISHLKKHSYYLHEGSIFKLNSRWCGYEIEITI